MRSDTRSARLLVMAAAAALVAIVVAGCAGGHAAAHSGSSAGSTSAAGLPSKPALAPQAKIAAAVPEAQSGLNGDIANSSAGTSGSAANGSVANTTTTSTSTGTGTGTGTTPLPGDSAVIVTGSQSVQVLKVDTAAAAVYKAVAAMHGQVTGDDRSSDVTPGDAPATPTRIDTATLQLRVPPDDATTLLGRTAALGTELSRKLSQTDVTAKVADVTSRVSSAEQSIARLRTLYADANSVDAVIEIERELSGREADLESLEAQQRALAEQTAMATLTVTLTTKAPPVPPAVKHKKTHRGFLGGLGRGWDAFTGSVVAVLTGLGLIAPFGIVAVLALIAAVQLLRRRRRAAPVTISAG